MRRKRKSIWKRNLFDLPVVQLISIVLTPVVGIYGLWGAIQQRITVGRWPSSMTYYGADATALGLSMFFGIFAAIIVVLTMDSKKVKIHIASMTVAFISLMTFVLTLINRFFDII